MFSLPKIVLASVAALSLWGSAASVPAHAAQASSPFGDIAGSYAKDAIVRLYAAGVVTGSGNRLFEPRKTVTRAEFVAMLSRLFALEPAAGAAIQAFADVPKTAWSYKWIQAASHVGLAGGVSPTRFGPDTPVTRQEAAVLMARALKLSTGASSGVYYYDQDLVSPWALPAVFELRRLGVMSGSDGYFRPDGRLTKQEAAVLMDQVLGRKAWSAQFKAAPPASIQIGWQYGQTLTQFEKQVAGSNVNTLSPRWFFLGATGGVDVSADAAFVKRVHAAGKKVWAMVGNRSNQALTTKLLSNPERRALTVRTLADAARKYGLDGLNLDFEDVSPDDRDGMTAFVGELAAALRAVPATLSVNVSPDLGTDWTEAFDYAAIGRSADYVVLMCYDEHWGGSPKAGSVSSIPWLSSAMDKLRLQVPAGKTIVAMPFYTRDWTTGTDGTKSTEWSLVQQNEQVSKLKLKPVWNETLGQYVASYSSQGKQHSVWLEDGRSLSRKLQAGLDRGVAGFAFWYMGGESADVWTSMRNEIRFSHYSFD